MLLNALNFQERLISQTYLTPERFFYGTFGKTRFGKYRELLADISLQLVPMMILITINISLITLLSTANTVSHSALISHLHS